MTTPNNPADIAPGRIGLDAAVQNVKDANTADNGEDGGGVQGPSKKETRGRKSKAQKEAEDDKKFDDLAGYAVNLIKQPIDAYAQEIDPYLVEVGYPKDITFSMKPEEEEGTKLAFKIVLSKIDPERLAKWAPWVVCGGILLQLTVPRYLMVSKIRAYIREKEEKENATVETTGVPIHDNPK